MSIALLKNYAFKTLNDFHKHLKLNNFLNKLVFGKFNLLYLNIIGLSNKLDDLESIIAEFTVKQPYKIMARIDIAM